MTPDITLELSIEQLISALNMKLFMECARVRPAPQTLQISRDLVAMLTAEVRFRSCGENSNPDDVL
jgi:hypothetical protein